MKMNNRFTLQEREGELKIKRKFLLFPESFDTPKTRWLEYADVVYEVKKIDRGEWGVEWHWVWVPVRFASDEDMRTIPIEKTEPLIDENSPRLWVLLDLLTILFILIDPGVAIFWLLAVKWSQYVICDRD